MENMTIGGAMLKEMFLTGAALLEKNRAYIDSLNVFPVPDGDTGTNMSMTMQSAVKEIQNCKGTNVSDIAAAASLGGCARQFGRYIVPDIKGLCARTFRQRRNGAGKLCRCAHYRDRGCV